MPGSSVNKILNLIKQQKGKCYYCGKNFMISDEEFSVDHLIPQCRGGRSTADNLVICCKKCNVEKSDMTEQEYGRYLKLKKLLTDKIKIKALNHLFLQNYLLMPDLDDKQIIELVNNATIDLCNNKGIIDIHLIQICRLFKQPPAERKIERAKAYYLQNRNIDKPLTIIRKGEENILIDGYARYCALKELGVQYAPISFCS